MLTNLRKSVPQIINICLYSLTCGVIRRPNCNNSRGDLDVSKEVQKRGEDKVPVPQGRVEDVLISPASQDTTGRSTIALVSHKADENVCVIPQLSAPEEVLPNDTEAVCEGGKREIRTDLVCKYFFLALLIFSLPSKHRLRAVVTFLLRRTVQ